MSLQWNLVALFLYSEILIVFLFMLPLASPQRWHKILQSNFMKTIRRQASWYFCLVLVILGLFFLDAIREMRKYSNVEHNEHVHSHLDSEMQANMRLFRAQRNFYISGFAIFLSFVIKRLINLLSSQAVLMAKSEAALKQAQSASTAAKNILDKSSKESKNSDTNQEKIEELQAVINSLKQDLSKEVNDKKALKSQADSVTKEYDRLLEEHTKLRESISGVADKKNE